MAKITQINSGDTGLEARTSINTAIQNVETTSGTFVTGDGTSGSTLQGFFSGTTDSIGYTGIIGIGTLTPSGDEKLQVTGAASISTDLSVGDITSETLTADNITISSSSPSLNFLDTDVGVGALITAGSGIGRFTIHADNLMTASNPDISMVVSGITSFRISEDSVKSFFDFNCDGDLNSESVSAAIPSIIKNINGVNELTQHTYGGGGSFTDLFGTTRQNKSFLYSSGETSLGLVIGTQNDTALILGVNDTEVIKITGTTVEVTGDLSVSGNITLEDLLLDDVSVGGNLSVTGTTTLNDNLIVDDDVNISGQINLEGSSPSFNFLDTDVGVGALITAESGIGRFTIHADNSMTASNPDISMMVSGITSFRISENNVKSFVDFTIDETLTVDGVTYLNNDLEVSDDILLTGNLIVTGTTTFASLKGENATTITQINTSFSDNDTSIMTSQAVKEKIEDYSYLQDGDQWTLTGDPYLYYNGGKVGIGTASPNYQLHIKDDVAGSVMLLIENQHHEDETSNVILRANAGYTDVLLDNLGQIKWQKEQTWTSTESTRNAYLSFNVATAGSNSEKMRITSDGYVGIGTTSPTTGGLHIDSNNVDINGFSDITSTSGNLTITTTEAADADQGGTILLGGRANSTAVTRAWAGIKGAKTNATVTNHLGYLAFYTASATVDLTEKMRIDAIGNIGIGTATPSQNLHIYDGTGSSTSGILIDIGDSGGGWLTIKNSDKPDGWQCGIYGASESFRIKDLTTLNYPFTIEDGASNNALLIDSSGNIGIGENLSVGGSLTSSGIITGNSGATITGLLDVEGNTLFNGQIYYGLDTLTDGTIATDCGNGNVHTITLEEDSTLSAPTNAEDGAVQTWIVTEDGTGGWTLDLTAFTLIGSETTINQGLNKISILTGIYNGSVWLMTIVAQS